jgi:hypothetical protein
MQRVDLAVERLVANAALRCQTFVAAAIAARNLDLREQLLEVVARTLR